MLILINEYLIFSDSKLKKAFVKLALFRPPKFIISG